MGEPDNRRQKIILCLAGLVFILAVILLFLKFFSHGKVFKVVFFNVGQGDSSLIRLPSGAKMLVDCGPDKTVLGKLGKYLPFYDRTLDYLFVTHFDADHYGGCVEVLRRYQVKNVYINGDDKPDDAYWQKWSAALRAEGASVKIVSAPMSLNDGTAEIDFFAPRPAFTSIAKTDSNNHSVVFRLAYGTTTVFYAGDMELKLEGELLAAECGTSTAILESCDALESDYLKVGHHGSDSSSGEAFLSAVRPEISIISVGKNKFGHPSLRVIRKLDRVGAKIWRTDKLNDIILR
jgi:competence protein ComEC